MNSRQTLLDWAEQGRIAPANLRRALESAGALPTLGGWRSFLDHLLLWMGTVLTAAGVIFFFAYNWQDLGRFAKFGLVEALVVAALVFVWRLGVDRPAGKATLLAASLLVGTLLALVGQIYQTGADPYELFTVWALAILPWVILGRFSALWMLWLALVNLAVTLYYQAFHGFLGFLFGTEELLWTLLALNMAALAVWEISALKVAWLRERWGPRLIATAGGAIATSLAMRAILENDRNASGAAAWLAWLAIVVAVYRRRIPDVYILAGAVLSVIVVVVTFLVDYLEMDAGEMLFVGLLVIGLSAAGGWWLRRVAAETSEIAE